MESFNQINQKQETKKTTKQTCFLEDRSKLTLTGVAEVVSAQPTSVIAKSSAGVISISGNDLRVDRLVLEEGLLVVVGDISGMKYSGNATKKSLFARLFK